MTSGFETTFLIDQQSELPLTAEANQKIETKAVRTEAVASANLGIWDSK